MNNSNNLEILPRGQIDSGWIKRKLMTHPQSFIHSKKKLQHSWMELQVKFMAEVKERFIASIQHIFMYYIVCISRKASYIICTFSFICRIKLQTFRFGFALLTRHPFATITSRLHAMPWHKLIAKKSSSYKNEIYIWEKEKKVRRKAYQSGFRRLLCTWIKQYATQLEFRLKRKSNSKTFEIVTETFPIIKCSDA